MNSINERARVSRAAIPMISLAFMTTWGQSGASGCSTINHWQLGARKPYGARLFGVFALVQIGFKFPFGREPVAREGRRCRWKVGDSGATPSAGQRPSVTFRPTVPVMHAGIRA